MAGEVPLLSGPTVTGEVSLLSGPTVTGEISLPEPRLSRAKSSCLLTSRSQAQSRRLPAAKSEALALDIFPSKRNSNTEEEGCKYGARPGLPRNQATRDIRSELPAKKLYVTYLAMLMSS